MDIVILTVIGAIVGGLIGFAYDKYNQALDMRAECLAFIRLMNSKEETNRPEDLKDAYLDRIAEADDAYDSYKGDNHPAHEKQ